MKAVFTLAVLFLYSSYMFGLEFHSLTIDESLQRAKTENKNILVSYSASWCLPCSMMKSSVFQDVEISNMVSAEWIAVSVDYDDAHLIEWVRSYDVKCLPTHLILDKEGKIIARTEGGMSIAQFKSFLINKTTLQFEHVVSPKTSNTPLESNFSNTYGKIIVDGVLVDMDSPINSVVAELKTASFENAISGNNLTKSNISQNEFVIQLGAFSTLEKVKMQQKLINSNVKEQTLIIVDFNTEKLPYKLITKNRYSEGGATSLAQDLKALGVDCFVRTL